MVQLKQKLPITIYQYQLFISIPYGAIKTSSTTTQSRSIYAFQFLMVQLKREQGKEPVSLYVLFQFLMVQLKP